MTSFAVVVLLLGVLSLASYVQSYNSNLNTDRKAFISKTVHLFGSIAAVATTPTLASAFDNRLDDKFARITKTPRPSNLGISLRTSRKGGTYTGLAPCQGSPNCWCSSPPPSDNLARYLPAWRGSSIADVKAVIDTYEVGQQGIDGGGFKVMEYDAKKQYLYVQFQSYRAAYIDDLEVWYNPEKEKFDLRSASRIGQSDLGVNGKRLDYIGGRLEKEYGWKLERRKNGSLV